MVHRKQQEEIASKAEQVTFRSWSPFLLRDFAQKRESVPELDVPAGLHLPATAPKGAVLVLQGLGGPKDHRERAYGALLAQNGYLALVPNSFLARGIRSESDTVRALYLTEAMMLADAFASLAYLARRPGVHPKRVFVIGFSYGGMTAVLTAYRQLAELFLPGGPRFAGHVSYYGCSIPRLEDSRTTGSPVLMLLAEKDRNVSMTRAEQIAADLRRGGSAVRVETFENVYHQWDGNDVRKRHVLFNLRASRVRVDAANEVWDERTGMRVTGRASRTLVIAGSADPRGYTIQQSVPAQERSDRLLFSFLDAVAKEEPAPIACAT